ncbi:hypothetical protein [Cupriavidus basilensis]|uniref:hypothetical protein n=1 Tax=Cupriavidus basilensis TaxID=68895 RepID=UPI000750B143|nr:hypothetical protein [Cupriavidus basilensis]
MRTLKLRQALLLTATAATLAGAAGLASAAPRSVDPYLDGAATAQRADMVSQSANPHGPRDPYTDGGGNISPRDVYVDASRNGPRDPFTDGA